ncbi:MAG: ribosome recycling factor [Bacteroidetes bacterium]|nr:ribosome recycling factor [Bacteroidota bacterium]MBV6461740.1 Ribosome-recycling factor [Flavobacteriales bacterium]WKZ75143.1 MAG: ribosome recycling factor [Vicingaceae bacterium]MCL4815525.1 ribosome recycling factor [Flavobacteriales bacterium]NOG95959.1 ribosome recycling factor [Bacteroidota bacterium]
MEEVQFVLDESKEQMEKAISRLNAEVLKIRAGKANPMMLEGVRVDYYGSSTPLSQISNINTPDPRTLSIQPWEKSMLEPIQKAITNANLGLNPQNNGELIMINVPPLTEERRKQLVKQAKNVGEDAKVSVRSARKEGNDEIKKLQKEGIPEDVCKDAENKIQKLTDSYIEKIDAIVTTKEKEILTV